MGDEGIMPTAMGYRQGASTHMAKTEKAAQQLNKKLNKKKLGRYEIFARKLKILCEPNRLAIIDFLGTGPKNVGAIVESMQMEQSLISHHLRILKSAGFLESEKRGKVVYYRLGHGIDKGRSELALDLGCCRISMV